MKGVVFHATVCAHVDEDGTAGLEIIWPDRRIYLHVTRGGEAAWSYFTDDKSCAGGDLESLREAIEAVARWQAAHDEHRHRASGSEVSR